MSDYIIITNKEQLKELFYDLFAEFILQKEEKQESDTMNLVGLLEFLDKQGLKTSKSHIYKYTSLELIPHMKIGRKLLFSRKDILEWIDGKKKLPIIPKNPEQLIVKHMRIDHEDLLR